MDIDVKNAYVKMTQLCGTQMQDIIIEDVYRFIKYISITGADERFETFCKIYVQCSILVDKNNIESEKTFISKAISCISRVENNAIASIVAFFTVIRK